jgi:hypothetical protein
MFGSPTAYLLWAILACIVSYLTGWTTVSDYPLMPFLSLQFLTWLIRHLWIYDRFKCLQWRGGQQRGTFRRIMTYVRTTSLSPYLLIFSCQVFLPRDRTPASDIQRGFNGDKVSRRCVRIPCTINVRFPDR